MERNVMGELNVYRGSGAKPNFSEIARRHGMDRHTVAKYWREGESAADGRSARGSAFDPLEEVIRAKAQLPGMTKMAVYAFLREGRGEGLPGYGAFTAWCRARDVPFGGAGGREPHPRFETPPGRQLQFDVSVNIIFTISTNAFSPIAPTRIRRIRQRGCAAFGA